MGLGILPVFGSQITFPFKLLSVFIPQRSELVPRYPGVANFGQLFPQKRAGVALVEPILRWDPEVSHLGLP